MALAGAIEAQLWAIERRGHVKMFREELVLLDAGQDRSFFGLVDKDHVRNPIADAFIEKYGMLKGTLPTRVIKFSQVMWGIRVDAARLAGEFNGLWNKGQTHPRSS
jgi:hypothetical protein